VLLGLKAKDIKQLDVLIGKAILPVFRAERISEEIIEQYLKTVGDVAFHKTKNRSMVARLNQACDHVDEEALEYGHGVDIVLEEGIVLSDFIRPHTFVKYVYDFGDNWRHDIIIE